jgi:fructokinase
MIAGVELGGTKCVAILGDGPDRIVARQSVPTTSPVATLAALDAVLDVWKEKFAAIGIATFGPVDLDPSSNDHGMIVGTAKPGWDGTRLLAHFAERYGVPTAIQTDVVGAALAEGRWGAARGLADHVYITIGTGVGVGVIAGGRPVGGVTHGEAGHLRIARSPGDSFAGGCTFHGDCVEGLIAGPALALRAGRPGAEIKDDDPVWAAFAHDLGGLLHNLVVTLAPRRIAIGGGVMAVRPALFAPIRAALAKSLGGYGLFARYAAELEARIGPPGLGVMAGPLGAIAVGLEA